MCSMELTKVAHGTQWRAYCPACDVGLNWHTDPAGTAAAERFTDNHNMRHANSQREHDDQ